MGFVWGQLDLCDKPVHFINNQHRFDMFHPCLSQHSNGLRANAFDRIDQHHGAITESGSCRDLTGEVNMSGRVNQVDEVLVGRGLGFWGCPPHQPEVERDGGGLHGDAAELLVGSGIEIADATGELAGDDAIGGKKAVGKGSFAMILHR